MATLCKNCAAPLVFDPLTQRVVCRSCGSSWTAEEVESSDKKFREQEHAKAVEDVVGVDDSLKNEYFDCYIYTCGSCGGEISINGTEASTKCIYCGSTSVVFDRISKEKAPEFIIPFSISKEQAVDLIKARFKKGLFIPKEVKNFSPSEVRGIYIPYWIANAFHVEADVISSEVKSGKHTVTKYWGRSGKMAISNLPVDASVMLSDDSSQRLEPFDTSALKLFDEDYLLGFYSNVSDITNEQLQTTVHKRAREAFHEQVLKTVRGSSRSVDVEQASTIVDQDVRYAMLPVWFVTYDYMGKHNTIMVNGQTGKVVCGAPWNEKLFMSIVAGVSSVLTFLLTLYFSSSLVPSLFRDYNRRRQQHYSSENDNNPANLIIVFIFIGVFLCVAGFSIYKKVKKQLQLTQASSIFNFMKKRQG